jgi:hypothetical protein
MAHVTRTRGASAFLNARLAQIDQLAVQVGWFATSHYNDKNNTPVAYVAAIQEFGYAPKNIPPRMGLREMFQVNAPQYAHISKTLALGVLNGDSAYNMMTVMGGKIAGDIRRAISNVYLPPLAQSTLENRARKMGLKGASALTFTGGKPLIDSGLMQASVTFVVIDKSEAQE